MRKNIFALAVLLCITAGLGFGAIDWNNPSFSIALTKSEIEAISGTSSDGATSFSCSFINDWSGNLLLIQDPSGGTGSGTGLLVIDLASKTGSVRVTDAALNAVCDQDILPVDTDVTGLALDTWDDSVYIMDRHDTDQIIKVSSGGVASALPGITGDTIGLNGVVCGDLSPIAGFETMRNLYYVNTDTGAVMEYPLEGSTEYIYMDKTSWTSITGGTQNGISAGPVLFWGNSYSFLIFDEASFGGTDSVIEVPVVYGDNRIFTPASVFGPSGAGLSTMVVTEDLTIIGWDEFGTPPNNFIIVPQGTETPIRIPRSTIAAALGIPETDINPSDENSMLLWIDEGIYNPVPPYDWLGTRVEVLFGISGPTSGGCIGKMTFTSPVSLAVGIDWNMY